VADSQLEGIVATLDGILTVRTIDEARVRLVDALARGSTVRVDCSAVVEADVSLIQLLLAARRSAARDGRTLSLAHPAEGVLLTTLLQGGFLAPDRQPRNAEEAFWLQPTSSP
jgi:ABC-type transporter Mla MlaB component